MYQLFEIQCALKPTRRSLIFLLLEESISLDVIISLMPFLVELFPPKKPLTMNSLPNPKFTALVIVLPPMLIYLDLKKNFSCGTGSLGSACIRYKSSCNLSKLMNPLAFVMKCLLPSSLFSSLLKSQDTSPLSVMSIGML